jgi:hypothetical protein
MMVFKRFLVLILLVMGGIEATAQLVSVHVNIPAPPPPRRYYSRPACPSPNHVWHEGHWVWDRQYRDYVWYDGYWEYIPPPPPPCETRYHAHGRGKAKGHYKKQKHWRD